jgi:multiple sugar transport system substrate-binding protein
VLKAQTEEWNKQTGATVKIEIINQNDLQAKSTAAVESGAGPDIIMMRHNWPHLYETKLADVSDLAEKLGKDFGGYYDVEVANNKVNGVWRAVPQNLLPNAIVYRADIVKEVTGSDKFPATYDELAKVGAEIKKAKKMGFGQAFGHAINDGNSCAYADMWAFGGKEVEQDGKKVAIASKETLASIQWHVDTWKSVFDETGLGWDDSSNNRAFLAGEIWATNNGASIYLAAKRDNIDMHKNMLHSPNPKGPVEAAHYHVTNQLAILGYSKNIPAAKEYIAYLMSKDVYSKWLDATEGFHTGPTKAWEQDPVWKKDPKMELFRDIGKLGHQPGWASVPTRKASEALSKFIVIDMYAKAINGSMSPQAAMDWAAGEFKKIYEAV